MKCELCGLKEAEIRVHKQKLGYGFNLCLICAFEGIKKETDRGEILVFYKLDLPIIQSNVIIAR